MWFEEDLIWENRQKKLLEQLRRWSADVALRQFDILSERNSHKCERGLRMMKVCWNITVFCCVFVTRWNLAMNLRGRLPSRSSIRHRRERFVQLASVAQESWWLRCLFTWWQVFDTDGRKKRKGPGQSCCNRMRRAFPKWSFGPKRGNCT